MRIAGVILRANGPFLGENRERPADPVRFSRNRTRATRVAFCPSVHPDERMNILTHVRQLETDGEVDDGRATRVARGDPWRAFCVTVCDSAWLPCSVQIWWVGAQPLRMSRTSPEWRNWQTRWIQNPVPARACGFESHLRHCRKLTWSNFPRRIIRPGLFSARLVAGVVLLVQRGRVVVAGSR